MSEKTQHKGSVAATVIKTHCTYCLRPLTEEENQSRPLVSKSQVCRECAEGIMEFFKNSETNAALEENMVQVLSDGTAEKMETATGRQFFWTLGDLRPVVIHVYDKLTHIEGGAQISIFIRNPDTESMKRFFEILALEEFEGVRKRVTELKMENASGISKIWDRLAVLEHLSTLSITDSKISAIPDSLFNLKTLQALNLDCNLINEIPASIKNLERLETFSLARNKLYEFPASICSLRNLTHVWLSHNGITAVPSSVNRMPMLSYLGLVENPLKKMPKLREGITCARDATSSHDDEGLAARIFLAVAGKIWRLLGLPTLEQVLTAVFRR